MFVAVETWHNSEACPNLIACTPNGYHCVEKAHSCSAKDTLNVKTNHGGVSFLQVMLCHSSNSTAVISIDEGCIRSLSICEAIVRCDLSTRIYCSPLAIFYDFADVVESHVCPSTGFQYSRERLCSLRFTKPQRPNGSCLETIKRTGVLHYKGTRTGRRIQVCRANHGNEVTCLAVHPIDVMIGNICLRRNEFRRGQSHDLVYVQKQQLARPTKFG